MLIILTTGSDSYLHTPMYFFLSNLSLVVFCFISTTVPKMLKKIQVQTQSISYGSCLAEIYFFLMAMAYNRYVAICHPCNTPL